MFEKLKIYAEITDLWSIARRYFVNNFYDGMLTVLGVLLGFFALIINGTQDNWDSSFILYTGFGSAISMLISGLTGSYLSERAEQKKRKDELDRAMILKQEQNGNLNREENVEDIQKAMVTDFNYNSTLFKRKRGKEKKPKNKSIQEKAEGFASIIVAIVNGFSPFLGGILPLIPFFFVPLADLGIFIIAFTIIFVCIILLGIFLGFVSKGSIIKNIIQMIIAFLLTIGVSLLFLGVF